MNDIEKSCYDDNSSRLFILRNLETHPYDSCLEWQRLVLVEGLGNQQKYYREGIDVYNKSKMSSSRLIWFIKSTITILQAKRHPGKKTVFLTKFPIFRNWHNLFLCTETESSRMKNRSALRNQWFGTAKLQMTSFILNFRKLQYVVIFHCL